MSSADNLVHFIQQGCLKYDGQTFINTAAGQAVSYREYLRLCTGAASYLRSFSIRPGDRVSVILPNIPEFLVLLPAIWSAGGIAVNLNINFTADEIQKRLADAAATMVITTPAIYERIQEALSQLGIAQVLLIGPAAANNHGLPLTDLDALKQLPYDQALPLPAYGREQIAFLQYTGGTTGGIKAAEITHGNVLSNVGQIGAYFSGHLSESSECIPVTLPLYHVFAVVLQVFYFFSIGGTCLLYPYPRELDTLIGLFKKYRITFTIGVNTMYKMLLQSQQLTRDDLKNIKLCMGGGEHVPVKTKEDWLHTTGITLHEVFGMTETSALAIGNPIGPENNPETIGLPIPGTKAILLDEQDREVTGDNIPGEILLQGPQVVTKYWNRPEENEASFKDGWLRTGDVAVWVNGRYLKIIDRKKDMISVSGFKVFPNEVEAVIGKFPGIRDCSVIGVADEKTGEKVVAFVCSDQAVDADALIAFCKRSLTAYKIPRQIVQVREIPKSPIGKSMRSSLRKQYTEIS